MARYTLMNSIDLLNLLDTLSIYRRKIIRSLDTAILKLPINTTQERVLMAILKIPDLKMKELSEQVGLEKSSLTHVIDSLIEEGFVIRNYDIQDRRKINCSLTKKGLAQAGKIDKLMIEHIDNYFSGMSQNEKDRLFNNLTHAVNTLSKYLG
jgi:MarR family transcriptional regulator, organic hydroperoxide resistance regulator